MQLSISGLTAEEVPALQAFAAEMYGRGAYQAENDYIEWLYRDNPASRSLADCIVARSDGAIVGCVHRMRVPCISDDRSVMLASLQNHVVSSRLRGGAGVMLLQRAVRDEDLAFSPGVSGRLGDVYRRLGYHEIPSYWLIYALSPLTAVWQRGMRTLSKGAFPSPTLGLATALEACGVRGTATPDAHQIESLLEALQKQNREQDGTHVAWTADLLRWRYFSESGPAHLLVEDSLGGKAVLSLGVRSRVNVARLMEYVPGSDPAFMKGVLRLARRAGASVAFAYSTRPSFRDQLVGEGWRLRRTAPGSFAKGSEALSLTAGATDVGFEAVLTKVSK